MDSEGLYFDQQAALDQARVTSFRSDIFDKAYFGGAPFKSSDVEGVRATLTEKKVEKARNAEGSFMCR